MLKSATSNGLPKPVGRLGTGAGAIVTCGICCWTTICGCCWYMTFPSCMWPLRCCGCCCCCGGCDGFWSWLCGVSQPHFCFNSVLTKPTRQPVSCRILSNIWSTSSCSRRSVRGSAAMASDLSATLATPRSLTCALIPQMNLEFCSSIVHISGSLGPWIGLICASRTMEVW